MILSHWRRPRLTLYSCSDASVSTFYCEKKKNELNVIFFLFHSYLWEANMNDFRLLTKESEGANFGLISREVKGERKKGLCSRRMNRLLARVNIQRCGFHIFPPSILHFVRKMLIEKKKKKADRAFFIPFRTVSDEKKRAYYIYTHNMMMNRSGRPKKKIKRPPQRCYNIPPLSLFQL